MKAPCDDWYCPYFNRFQTRLKSKRKDYPLIHFQASKIILKDILQIKAKSMLIYVLVAVVSFSELAFCEALQIGDLNGFWRGAISKNGASQIVEMEFISNDGHVQGTYNIPELGFYQRPIDSILLNDDGLHLSFLYGNFTCQLHSGLKEITGMSNSNKSNTKIHLKSAIPPSRGKVEDVFFTNGQTRLAGTILFPSGRPPFPSIVIAHDANPRSRESRAYRTHGEIFRRNGFAALIFDKRGVGESDGNFDLSTFTELTGDIVAAAKFLSQHNSIDKSDIGVWGFSQGGWLGPLAASQCEEISFVVSFAGPAESVWEQEIHRVEYQMRAAGFPEQDITSAVEYTKTIFECVVDRSRWPQLKILIEVARTVNWSNYLDLPDSAAELDGWLREQYDPREVLMNSTVPILAIYGSADLVVPSEINAPLMSTLLKSSGNRQSRVIILPQVKHKIYTGQMKFNPDQEWPHGFWKYDRLAPGLYENAVKWSLDRVSDE